MNERILKEFKEYLCREYRKYGTICSYYIRLRKFLKWLDKPVEDLTKDDLLRWRSYINQKFAQNGNISRVVAVNVFLRFIGKHEEWKIPVPPPKRTNKTPLNREQLDKFLEASEDDYLHHLIALLEIDGLLRPSEITEIKISNIDFDTQRLFLEDTKTGDNYIIISPRLQQAIESYFKFQRPEPLEKYKDYLLIIPSGRKLAGHKFSVKAGIIRDITKRIAIKADIKRKVTPYVIKPSSITRKFEERANPRVIQRMARHKNIKTTLIYDLTDENSVREYFQQQTKIDINNLSPKDKARLWLDKFISGEIDSESFKKGIDTIKEIQEKQTNDIDYIQ